MGHTGKAHEAVNLCALRLIRGAFEAAQITQQDLADKSGVPRSTIANLLTEDRTVNVDTLARLAHALGPGTLKRWAVELEEVAREGSARRVSVTDDVYVTPPSEPPPDRGRRTRSPRSAGR